MSNLPQVQDWFYNLLLPSQWVFLWIVMTIIITVVLALLFANEGGDYPIVGPAIVLGILVPLFLFSAIIAVLNFVSFMIWLWSGAPL